MAQGRFVLGLIAVLIVLSCKATDSVHLTVHYIPFSVRTYLPVTPRDIRRKAWCVVRSAPASIIAKLEEIFAQKTPGEFDAKMVRVRIDLGGSIGFVDAKGGFRWERRDWSLDLNALEDILKSLCGGQDCMPPRE